MECLKNFVIKVNVMFWCNGCVASINLNLNSVFKILIPCNYYCSLAGGGVLAVLATLLRCTVHWPRYSLFSPFSLCSSAPRFMPQSHCLLGAGSVLQFQDPNVWLVQFWTGSGWCPQLSPACHILIALVACSQTRPRAADNYCPAHSCRTALLPHSPPPWVCSTHACSIRILLSKTHGGTNVYIPGICLCSLKSI